MTVPASIAKALVEAQRHVGRVEKGSTNKHFSYKYASADDTAAEAKRALNLAGLALCRVGWTHTPLTEHEPARLTVSYMLTSSEGDCWPLAPVSVPSLPGAGRPEDKAEAAALTYSAGYVAQGLLQIERVDEHDPDARGDEGDRTGRGAPPEPVTISAKAKALLAAMVAATDAKSKAAADKLCLDAWEGLNKAERALINEAEAHWRKSRGEA